MLSNSYRINSDLSQDKYDICFEPTNNPEMNLKCQSYNDLITVKVELVIARIASELMKSRFNASFNV